MDYGGLIKEAFWISWRNKFLWFFGFFVAGSGSANFPSVPSGGGSFDDFDPGRSGSSSTLAVQAGQGMLGNVALLVALGIFVLLVALFLFFMYLVSDGGLAASVAALRQNEVRSFGLTWRSGLSNFWRVLGLRIILILISLALLLAIVAPALLVFFAVFAATESLGVRVATGVFVGGLALVLLVVIFVPLAIIGHYALRGLVVGREQILGSIGGGFRLFRGTLGRSLLVWIIQIAIRIGATIALLIALLILGLLLALPAIGLFVAEYATAGIVAAVIAVLLFLIPAVIASGALGAFNHAYWTLAYLRLAGPAEGPISESASAVR